MVEETELQTRLRRAKEALEYSVQKESEARQTLRRAEETRRIAKDRYEVLFLEEENAESARRKAIYNHCTK